MLVLLSMLPACKQSHIQPAMPKAEEINSSSQQAESQGPLATDAASLDTRSAEEMTTADASGGISEAPVAGNSEINPSLSSSSIMEQLAPWLNNATLPGNGLELREEMTSITSGLASTFEQQPDVLEIHARALALVGNLEEAQNVWSKILEIDPQYGYALQGMGSAAKLEGQLELAADYFEQAYKTQSDNAKLVHELAETRTLLGQIEGAAELLKDYTEAHPESVETWVLLGQALLSLKQYEKSQAAFERALELHPELPRAQQGLGQVLVRLGKRDEARKLLVAQKESREQQDTSAIPPEQKLKMEMRDSAELYYQASRILAQLGHADIAMALAQRAAEHHPQNLAAWRFWMSLAQTLNTPAVLEICQSMVQANPDKPSAHYELGMLQLAVGKHTEAQRSMNKVLELSPNDPAGYEGLVRALLTSSGNTQLSIETAEKLVQLAPTAKSYDLLAQTLAVAGEMKRALENVERALELEPNNAQYRFAKEQLEKLLGQQP